jgi:CTP:molybdopterin cytidylyltransferase MocA
MERPDHVAAVILAAGESRRYGSPKQLALLEGRTLLEHVLEAARAAGLRPVAAVVPVWLSRPASAAPSDELVWLRNPSPERGMSYSLRLGLEALPPDASAAIILLGDQPGVQAAQLRALVAARGPRPIIASEYDGLLSPPVLLERSEFAATSGLVGDIGLRDLIRSDPDRVIAVPAEPLPDIDVPEDLARPRRDGGRG